ncbi:MAG: hypothetical protein ACI4KA_06510 [Oscillospiraceae bacterium]
MEFLYVFSLIFLSIFGLVMLIKSAVEAFMGKDKDIFSDMGVGRKRR